MKNQIIQFRQKFDSEDKCLNFLYEKRFHNGIHCPICGHKKVYAFSDCKTWKCSYCRKKFNVKTGTIFAGSKITLSQWFIAIFLLTSNKKQISLHQLANQVGVTNKTAYFMNYRIYTIYKQGID